MMASESHSVLGDPAVTDASGHDEADGRSPPNDRPKSGMFTYIFMALCILRSHFTEKGFKRTDRLILNIVWCYRCFYLL